MYADSGRAPECVYECVCDCVCPYIKRRPFSSLFLLLFVPRSFLETTSCTAGCFASMGSNFFFSPPSHQTSNWTSGFNQHKKKVYFSPGKLTPKIDKHTSTQNIGIFFRLRKVAFLFFLIISNFTQVARRKRKNKNSSRTLLFAAAGSRTRRTFSVTFTERFSHFFSLLLLADREKFSKKFHTSHLCWFSFLLGSRTLVQLFRVSRIQAVVGEKKTQSEKGKQFPAHSHTSTERGIAVDHKKKRKKTPFIFFGAFFGKHKTRRRRRRRRQKTRKSLQNRKIPTRSRRRARGTRKTRTHTRDYCRY